MKNNYSIAIIDYGMSNMFSIKNALVTLGFDVKITSNYSTILSSDGAILPGVGSFPEAMKNIHNLGLDRAIYDFIATKKKFMGICLGFHLLFDESNEIVNTQGLGIVAGKVECFPEGDRSLRVPHVGWSVVKKNESICNKRADVPLKNLDSDFFYFVHSYYASPEKNDDIYTTTKYGDINYCSSILYENIFACQFHPEKSGNKGVLIFKNFFN